VIKTETASLVQTRMISECILRPRKDVSLK
jgi:hypothetical protein